MTASTVRAAIPYPLPADPNDIPAHMQALAQRADDIFPISVQGLISARPVTPPQREFYWATDDRGGKLHYGDGSQWWEVGPGPATGPVVGSHTAMIQAPSIMGTADPVVKVRGKSGQTGDLTKYQNSAGTTDLLRVNSAGSFFQNLVSSSTPSIGSRVVGDAQDRYSRDASGAESWGAGSGAADTFLGRVAAGRLSLTGSLGVFNNQATNTGLTVNRASGQSSGYIVAARDEVSAVLAGIQWNGLICTSDRLNVGSLTTIPGSPVVSVDNTIGTGNPVIGGRAISGQSADLLQMVDSSNVKRFWVGAGGLTTADPRAATTAAYFGDSSQAPGGTVGIMPYAGSRGLVIRQPDTSPSSVFEWQDSLGAILGRINSLGNITGNDGGTAAAPSFSFVSNANMGMYRPASNVLGFSVPSGGSFSYRNSAGVQVAGITDGGEITATDALKSVAPGLSSRLYVKSTDSPSNAKTWDLAATGSTLIGRTLTDADAVGDTWLTVTRSGSSVSSVAIKPPTWTTVSTYSSPWGANGSVNQVPRYCKDAEGFVHIEGRVKASSATGFPSTIFTLPVGFRPPAVVGFTAIWDDDTSHMLPVEVLVYPTGAVVYQLPTSGLTLYPVSPERIELSGITFSVN